MQHNPDSSGPPIRARTKVIFFVDPDEVTLVTLETGACRDTISSKEMRTEDRKGGCVCDSKRYIVQSYFILAFVIFDFVLQLFICIVSLLDRKHL